MDIQKKMTITTYKYEKTFFVIALIISALAWTGIIVGTKGIIFAVLPFFFLLYLFAQSRFVSYLKGTGALVSSQQMPELQKAVETCAAKIGLKKVPAVYVLHMNGMFNAFALKFLRKTYIVLLSDIVDALESHPDALNFYIGHEMGHIHRNHTSWEVLLTPALILPLLGAGYSRSREYTCDRYGAACCENPESARLGLAALAVGGRKFSVLSPTAYLDQMKDTKGFWMSFHELISNYPWLVKRYARVGKDDDKVPSRNPFAYIFAIFIPRFSLATLIILYVVFIGFSISKGLQSEQEVGAQTSYEEPYEGYKDGTDTSAPQPDQYR